MPSEEALEKLQEMLKLGFSTVQTWFSTSAITPEINTDLSNMTMAISSSAFIQAGIYDPEFTNLCKCVVSAAFQLGRRHPLANLNWIVNEENNEQT